MVARFHVKRGIDIAKSIEYREIFEITSYINNTEYEPKLLVVNA